MTRDRRTGVVGAVVLLLAGGGILAVGVLLVRGLVELHDPQFADRAPVTAAGTARPTPELTMCGSAVRRPATFPERCNSNHHLWVNLHWSFWSRRAAYAVGEYQIQGPSGQSLQTYPVRLQLSDVAMVAGRPAFTRLTMTFTARSPGAHRIAYEVGEDQLTVVKETP